LIDDSDNPWVKVRNCTGPDKPPPITWPMTPQQAGAQLFQHTHEAIQDAKDKAGPGEVVDTKALQRETGRRHPWLVRILWFDNPGTRWSYGVYAPGADGPSLKEPDVREMLAKIAAEISEEEWAAAPEHVLDRLDYYWHRVEQQREKGS
jgi:hypothetical protein